MYGIPGGLVVRVRHASLQDKTKFDPATQLTGGYGATFAIILAEAAQAKALPSRLHYWIVSPWICLCRWPLLKCGVDCYLTGWR
jgi:hypothetical protein